MADADDVRQLALGLPHVVEIDSDGFDFRVGGSGFERQGRLVRQDRLGWMKLVAAQIQRKRKLQTALG